MEIRPLTADDLPAVVRTAESAFHGDVAPWQLDVQRPVFEPARSLAAFDGPEMVATAGIYTRELTVPGAVVPVAGVTEVGVRPSHRRQGLLTALMRRQIDDVRAGGEAIAALWASETGIYGRFGYGLAARHATLKLRTAGMRVRPDVAVADGRVLLLEPEAAIPRIAPLFDRLRRQRPGHLDRHGPWWPRRVVDPESERGGASALRVAVHERPDGAVDGYALYAVKPDWSDGPEAEVRVREVVAGGGPATAAMWSLLVGLDLTRSVTVHIAAPDEPLDLLLAGPSRVRVTTAPNVWVRLVDLPRALTARAYAAPLDVVLDVDDAFCPWNAGRHRLEAGADGARCERTDAPADLALSAADLGAAYLGGTSLAALHALGRVAERTPGALARATTAFRGAREPWCPEIF